MANDVNFHWDNSIVGGMRREELRVGGFRGRQVGLERSVEVGGGRAIIGGIEGKRVKLVINVDPSLRIFH